MPRPLHVYRSLVGPADDRVPAPSTGELHPEAWASLGRAEVLVSDLDLLGSDLEEALALVTGGAEARWPPPGKPGGLPRGSWREVATRPQRTDGPGEPRPVRVTLAAPSAADGSTWVMLELIDTSAERADWVGPPVWDAVSDGVGVRRRPGRETRRTGLRLALPSESLVIVAGQVPDVVATLHNTTREWWRADPDDDAWTVAQLTDEHPEPGAQLGWFAMGLAPALPDLPPLGSITLAAWIFRLTVQDAEPGRYGLVATLLSLGLRSEVRPVEIVADPRTVST